MSTQFTVQATYQDDSLFYILVDSFAIEKIAVDLERRLQRSLFAYFKSQGKAEDEALLTEAFGFEIASSIQLLARLLMHNPESAQQNADILHEQLVNELDRLFDELCQTKQ